MGPARRLRLATALVAVAGAFSSGGRAEPAAPDPSVYQINLPVDGTVIAVGALGGLLPFALSSRLIHPSCPCAPGSVNGFDRPAIGNHSDAADWISTGTVALAIAVPPLADWLALHRGQVWVDDMVVFAEALSVNGALVTLAKFTVQRPIPRVYADPALAGDPGNYRSFYSGHTSTAFAALSAAAVTIDARYRLTWQPWVATALVGGSVAAERVLSGYHFTSDVLVGAAAGAVVGSAVALLHLQARRARLSVFRPAGGSGAGIALGGWL